MKKFTVLVALALLVFSGTAYGQSVDLLTKIADVSGWECYPTGASVGHSDWFAGIARSPGLLGSYWRTEGLVTSLSPSSLPEDSRMRLNVYGDAYKLVDIDVSPWTAVGAADVVEVLSLPDGVYVINAVYPDNMGIVFRTYNDLGASGTYGSTLPKLYPYSKSFVSWPSQVGRRWLYVVVLDNASLYMPHLK